MLLVLNRKDLKIGWNAVSVMDATIQHFNIPMRQVYNANCVYFYDTDTDSIKVLKNRFGKCFIQFSDK